MSSDPTKAASNLHDQSLEVEGFQSNVSFRNFLEFDKK